MPPKLKFKRAYHGSEGPVDWQGKIIEGKRAFAAYMKGPVRTRFVDQDTFDRYLRDPTGPEYPLVPATSPLHEMGLHELPLQGAEPWMVAEALAQCELADDPELGIVWPWNMASEPRGHNTSTPGPDAVGFCRIHGELCLTFCEVKSSSDASSPPAVMRGPTGLENQLQDIATSNLKRKAGIKWLAARCTTPAQEEMLISASTGYNESGRMNYLLCGVLIRDTAPRSSDVAGAAAALAQMAELPSRVSIRALYLPVPLEELPARVGSS